MRIGLATSAFSDLHLTDAVRMCLRYSDHVHISPIYPQVDKKDIKELQFLKHVFDVDFTVHAPFPNHMEILDVGKKENLGFFKKSIDHTEKLRGDRVVIHGPTVDDKKTFYKNARKLVAYGMKKNVMCYFENRGSDSKEFQVENQMRELINEIPNCMLCFDTSHFYMWKQDIKELLKTIERLAPHIGIIHLVDTFKGQDAHMLPGYGELSLHVLTKPLLKIPDLKNTPIVLEDIEPYEFEKGILNIRHALIHREGMQERNKIGF